MDSEEFLSYNPVATRGHDLNCLVVFFVFSSPVSLLAAGVFVSVAPEPCCETRRRVFLAPHLAAGDIMLFLTEEVQPDG